MQKYGDALVCIRYRYDETTRTRLKTVELIIEKKELSPPKRQKVEDNPLVPVTIPYGERELGRMAKALGGRWDPDVKLWYIPKAKVKGTELEKHIILDIGKKRERK